MLTLGWIKASKRITNFTTLFKLQNTEISSVVSGVKWNVGITIQKQEGQALMLALIFCDWLWLKESRGVCVCVIKKNKRMSDLYNRN